MAESKIAVHSLPDLKNTSDDALAPYLTSLGFRQSHKNTDVRLALGYSAVVIAAVTFYYDYTLGWEPTKHWTAWAVAAYFVLNGVFTYWIWIVEKGVVYQGVDESGGRLTLASRTNKHDPTYHLTATYAPPLSARSQEIKASAPFSRFFHADGYLAQQPFRQWLASSVPFIGAADPNNVVEEIGRGSGGGGSGPGGIKMQSVRMGDMADVLEGLKKSGSSSGSKSGAGKARRRG
ncbi:microsomal signal peptidase 25 kDa subunit-domain-containing protein [Lineolata rhizophorae]|uniref:Signal peptidase complex subunit 2 n=1 Tax=Lineolata rhizophorae TaxID=578093 RepID=A0A6A6P7C4_9PEZI|nr:microsomal signal peptidase 25 kDa subunit-domain-containing protein [Lineolata rhizophorae]